MAWVLSRQIACAPNRLELICVLIDEAIPAFLAEDADALERYPFLNAESIPYYYKANY